MLNVNELETKWRKYKIKSYIPYVVILISTFIISIALYTIMGTTKTNNIIVTDITDIEEDIKKDDFEIIEQTPTKAQTNVKIIKEVVVKKDTYQNHPSNNQNIILSPSLKFMSNMKHNNIYNEDGLATSYSTPIAIKKVEEKKPQVIVEEVTQEPEEEIVEEVKTANIASIKIDRKSSQEDIEYVIKRFKRNNNPTLSLFIAKKYYSLHEYHKAYNYALITNELNDNIDSSWLIFAKSLVKLNEKDEAVKTLKRYIEHSHSSQAKILLDEIVSGDFK